MNPPAKITEIQGWFDWESYYFRIAQVVPHDAVLVELGPWLGVSTIFLAQSLQALGKHEASIHAVDTWRGSPNEQAVFDYVIAGGNMSAYDRFCAAIHQYGVSRIVKPLLSDSVAAARQFEDRSVDFIFFDTEHTEEHLSKELQAWIPKLKPSVFFGGHDIAREGVRRAVQKHVRKWWVDGPCWEAQNV